MPEDTLIDYLREGYPKQSDTAEGYQTILEYIGPQSTIFGVIEKGKAWGDYQGVVKDLQGEPITGTDPLLATLSIRMLRGLGDSAESSRTGIEQETIYEIDWVDITKPFIDHPAFAKGAGRYEIGKEERLYCLQWDEMDVPEFKVQYKYYPGRYSEWDGKTESKLDVLTGEGAIQYAIGRLLGIEYYVEKVPVLRKSTTYVDGVPPQNGAGSKENPSAFPEIPAGYEFIRSADRSTSTGKHNEWRRDQEWLGAKKVLVDSFALYYDETSL